MKKGTTNDDIITLAINNLKDWDGLLLFNENLLYRENDTKIKKIIDYFNDLHLSEIYIRTRDEILLSKKINLII